MKKANYYIKKQLDLNSEIIKNWNIIIHENINPKTRDRDCDLKELMIKLKSLINQRVQNKMHLQAINMGLKKFSDIPPDSNYLTIFWLSEFKDFKKKLSEIKTINSAKKKKASKGKKLTVTEVFSEAYKKKAILAMDIKIEEFAAKRELFNTSTEYDDEGTIIIDMITPAFSKAAA